MTDRSFSSLCACMCGCCVPPCSFPRSTYKTGFLPPPDVAAMTKILDPLMDVDLKAWGGYEQARRCTINKIYINGCCLISNPACVRVFYQTRLRCVSFVVAFLGPYFCFCSSVLFSVFFLGFIYIYIYIIKLSVFSV